MNCKLAFVMITSLCLLAGCNRNKDYFPVVGAVYLGRENISISSPPDEVVYFTEFISSDKIRYGFVCRKDFRILVEYNYNYSISNNQIKVWRDDLAPGALHPDWPFELLHYERLRILNVEKQQGTLYLTQVELKANFRQIEDEKR